MNKVYVSFFSCGLFMGITCMNVRSAVREFVLAKQDGDSVGCALSIVAVFIGAISAIFQILWLLRLADQ